MTEEVITVLIPTEVIEIIEDNQPDEYIEIVNQVIEVVEIAERGLPGEPGEGVPAGGATGQVLAKSSNTDYATEWVSPSAGSDANYIHDQPTASAIWTVTHNLGKYPSLEIVDSTKRKVSGAVQFIDQNSLTITFSAPFSGQVFIN